MVRRKKREQVPEPSSAARVVVASVAALTNLAFAAVTGMVLLPIAIVACIAAGHRASWRGRLQKRTSQGQGLIGVGLFAAVVLLVWELFGGLILGDLPQATFALLTQAITSFDLKSRRNLFSHLFHSLIILYVASLFAWSPLFLLAVIGWGVGFFAFLIITRTEMAAPSWKWPAARAGARHNAAWTLAWIGTGVAVFVALPEFAGRPFAIPLVASVPASANGAPTLPGILPLVGTTGGSADGINLRVRGPLGDEVAFRVRSSAPSYWRAAALESYDGTTWSPSEPAPDTITGIDAGINVYDEVPGSATGTISSTFFIERPLGTQVPTPYPVSEVYFPSDRLTLSASGTITAPHALGPGVNYGTVSLVRDTSPATLRSRDAQSTDVAASYSQLPDELPAEVGQLAAQVTQGATTEYDKVRLLTSYLSTRYIYDLNSPIPQSGQDAVDQFLFVDRRGFCEQFASALAVMLRTQNVPTRVVIGYATGQHDLLTSTYTVRNSDAHAWVEVYFPSSGWVPFDASPGFDASPATHSGSPWFFGDPSKLVSIGGVPGGAEAVGGGSLLIVAGVALFAALVRWRRDLRLPPPVRAYARSLRWLHRGGLPTRDPTMTVGEHLALLGTRSPAAARALSPIAGAIERSVFADDTTRVSDRAASRRLALVAIRYRLGGRRVGT